MKRAFTAAMVLLMFGSTVLAQTPEEVRAQRRQERQEAKQQEQQQKPQQPQQQPRRQQPAAQQPNPQQQQPRRQGPQQQQNPNFQPQPRRQQQPQTQNPFAPQQPTQRPQRPDRPDRPDRPRPDRPDRPRPDATPANPGGPATQRPDRPARPDRPDRPRPDRPDRPRPPRDDTTAAPDRPRPDRPRPDRPRPDQPRPDRPDRPRPDRPDRPRPDRPRAERPDRPARPDAPRDRRPRADLPTRPDRPGANDRRQRDQRFDNARSREKRQQARQARQADRRPSWDRRAGRRNQRVVRAARYRWQPGYRYRAYRRGDRFPLALALSTWFLTDWLTYGLFSPPSGYRWVRYGPDAVLIDPLTGDISDIRYGVFYDGSVTDDVTDGPGIDPSLPQAFLTGDLNLQGYGQDCDDFFGDDQLQDDIDAAWENEDWNGLARLVIDGDCDSDLSWFLLGLSAEGLELNEAAASYYQRSLDLYDEQYSDNCDAFEDACRGMTIGDEAASGLERIYGRED